MGASDEGVRGRNYSNHPTRFSAHSERQSQESAVSLEKDGQERGKEECGDGGHGDRGGSLRRRSSSDADESELVDGGTDGGEGGVAQPGSGDVRDAINVVEVDLGVGRRGDDRLGDEVGRLGGEDGDILGGVSNDEDSGGSNVSVISKVEEVDGVAVEPALSGVTSDVQAIGLGHHTAVADGSLGELMDIREGRVGSVRGVGEGKGGVQVGSAGVEERGRGGVRELLYGGKREKKKKEKKKMIRDGGRMLVTTRGPLTANFR